MLERISGSGRGLVRRDRDRAGSQRGRAAAGSARLARARAPGRISGLHRLPRDAGFGGARKAAFEYALRKGFDHVVFMRGDGLHPPEELPALVRPILDDPDQVVFAYRRLRLPDAPGSWKLIPNLVAHTFATGFQNRLLGLRLRDYHSGFRLYSMRAVERMPVSAELGRPPLRHAARDPVPCARRAGVRGAGRFRSGASTRPTRPDLLEVLRSQPLRGRLSAAPAPHLFRLGNYFVDEGVRYTFKHSETGSHMQIVRAIEPDSSVLDLGCSQGLLARPLRRRECASPGSTSRRRPVSRTNSNSTSSGTSISRSSCRSVVNSTTWSCRTSSSTAKSHAAVAPGADLPQRGRAPDHFDAEHRAVVLSAVAARGAIRVRPARGAGRDARPPVHARDVSGERSRRPVSIS